MKALLNSVQGEQVNDHVSTFNKLMEIKQGDIWSEIVCNRKANNVFLFTETENDLGFVKYCVAFVVNGEQR